MAHSTWNGVWAPRKKSAALISNKANHLSDLLLSKISSSLPDFTQPFCIEADTFEDGIGAVLKKGGRPIAYMSKALGMLNLGQ